MTTTAEPRVASADVLGRTVELEFAGRRFTTGWKGLRLEFTIKGQDEPFGFIRYASADSGAIWAQGDCIGEFAQDEEGFTIVPIQDGRKQPKAKMKANPMVYLLQRAPGGESDS